MSKRNENLKRKVASFNRAQNKATYDPMGQASILALELKSLKKEREQLELTLRTLERENKDLELANATLKENINSISKQIENLYSELEEHESRANMSIIRRTLSWPIFQYTRLRDREIRNRDKALIVQSEEISELKKKIRNQRIQINGLSEKLSSTKESESLWKVRHNQISKERREERGLTENSLINRLRETNLQKDKKIAELEELVISQSGDEIDPNIPTNVLHALEMARINYDIIELVGNARKSARNSPYAHPSKVLYALTEMAESAIEWNQNPEGSGPYENILDGLDVADGDSKDRFVTDGDSSLRMNRHVKLGVIRDPSKTLRIYYDIERGGKLKIGWCGEHPS